MRRPRQLSARWANDELTPPWRSRFGIAEHVGPTLRTGDGEAGALQRARSAGIAAYHLSGRTHPDRAALDVAICAVLERHAVDLVVLAGYMKQLGPQTLARFRGRVLNTHPALLPKFGGQGMYGIHVHRAVLAAGEAKTGASVHVATEEYDAGPVIAQCEVPVEPGDTPETLAERVQARERRLLDKRLSLRSVEACIICRQGRPDDILVELETSRVTVNEDAPMRGYACLVFRRHAVELHDLTEAEGAVFMRDIRRLSAALQHVTGAAKLNYEVHGNRIPHLHCTFTPGTRATRSRVDLSIRRRLAGRSMLPASLRPSARAWGRRWAAGGS